MTNIRFSFFRQNKFLCTLPVNPEKFEVTGPGNNSTENIISTGDINILKLPGLRSISFKTWIPARNNGEGYINDDVPILPGQMYVLYFEACRVKKEPLLLIVSGLNVVLTMGIESFNYYWEGADEDLHFQMELKEWKAYQAKVIETSSSGEDVVTDPATPQDTQPRENTAKKVAVGVTVLVNGQLHRDSLGSGPGLIEKNATRKVNFLAPGAPYPIHVATLSGGWRGWVAESAVQVI